MSIPCSNCLAVGDVKIYHGQWFFSGGTWRVQSEIIPLCTTCAGTRIACPKCGALMPAKTTPGLPEDYDGTCPDCKCVKTLMGLTTMTPA